MKKIIFIMLFIYVFTLTTWAGLCDIALQSWPGDEVTGKFKGQVKTAWKGGGDIFHQGPQMQLSAREIFRATGTKYNTLTAQGLVDYEVDQILPDPQGSALNHLAYELNQLDPQATFYYSASLLIMNRVQFHIASNVKRYFLPHPLIVRPDLGNFYLKVILTNLQFKADTAARRELSFLNGSLFPIQGPAFISPALERHPDPRLPQGLGLRKLEQDQDWVEFVGLQTPFYMTTDDREQILAKELP
ncbi:MAG: hypothetical protein WCG27_09150, partial [Pseudomonadota bacterium]